ncbi:MAG: sulfatase [Bryobacteraceae bacterium]|nr:sulfatase [Bryobacteraceae bacterium]
MIQPTCGRRAFLRGTASFLSATVLSAQAWQAGKRDRPNVVLILADDLGFGDLGCYGSKIPTPNLDRMAEQGTRLTRFYSASPVCSPSRAALLTGRYPARSGIVNVMMPWDDNGIPAGDTTLPKVLKEQGYRTACVGKWHLGMKAAYSPMRHFDEFYGLPYSNDMSPLPMLRNNDVVDSSVEQSSLLDQFTERAIDFIGRSKDAPFFLYFAHTAPHIPAVPSERFRGKSGHGLYGDVVMSLDWSVGKVLDALKSHDLDENTLVIFTSDNGPWYQGSAGALQGRKGSTYEGGVREPLIARMPGKIPAGGVSGALSSMMDLLPTIAAVCGAAVDSKNLDGVDMWPVLKGESLFADREVLLFFDGWHVQCARWGPWKLHFSRYNSYAWTVDPPGGRHNLPLPRPELYNVDEDPSEGLDMSFEKSELVSRLREATEQLLWTLPEQVRTAWRDTMAIRVDDTPTGSLPRRSIVKN